LLAGGLAKEMTIVREFLEVRVVCRGIVCRSNGDRLFCTCGYALRRSPSAQRKSAPAERFHL